MATKINRIYGIFNGTSNYILSSMDKNKTSFNETITLLKNLVMPKQIQHQISMVTMLLQK